MENLNDAEFGSDKSGEEAPILVAQRYLNIFRQVHIFNKAKRDQFDDELLALPTNITDFFKKMPGGRLLVEHIEEVKTERGISFVKSNKADFAEGSGAGGAPSGETSGGHPAQFVGGNVVMDASFAETLANSLAVAFKQLPASVSGGAPVNITADNGAFDLIAEEIRTSRASLLDVLKETRSITDTVIASQVSISRILEGILSARNRDENDVANLNNRIIASQASITKLLEGLYTANNKKNNEISDYLNVETKLQEFRHEVKNELDASLSKMQEMFREYAKTLNDRKVVIETKEVSRSEQPIHQTSQNRGNGNRETDVVENSKVVFSPVTANAGKNFGRDEQRDGVSRQDGFRQNEEERRKKKKKKFLNDGGNRPADVSAEPVRREREEVPQVSTAKPTTNPAAAVALQTRQDGQAINGVIRNQAFKHEDNFDNVRLEEPPLEDITESNEFSLEKSDSENIVAGGRKEEIEELDISDILSGFDTPADSIEEEAQTMIAGTAAQGDISKPVSQPAISDAISMPKNEKAAEEPMVPTEEEISGLDNLADDGLDFELPAQGAVETPKAAPVEEEIGGLDSFTGDGLDFELPAQGAVETPKATPVEEEIGGLDSFAGDGLDFELPAQGTVETPNAAPVEEEIGGLDSFAGDGLDFELPAQEAVETPVVPVEEKATPQTTSSQEQPASRYSAELDKIRAALTTDNIDLSSLDEPIALDDYSDDENVPADEPAVSSAPVSPSQSTNDEDWEYEYVEDDGTAPAATNNNEPTEQPSDEEWEWEYVDENGEQPSAEGNDEDWEWEYVDENDTPNESDNNKQ